MPLYEFPYGLNFVPFGANPEPYGKPLPGRRQVSVFLCALAALFFRRSLPFPLLYPALYQKPLQTGRLAGAPKAAAPAERGSGEGVGAYPAFAPEPERADRFRLYGVQGGPVREKTQDTGNKKVPRPGDFFAFWGGVPFFFCGAVLQ